MKLALMILFLILFLFAIIYPSEIYPSKIKKRIKAQYEEINISSYEGHIFKVRAGAYFACIFDVLFMGFFFVLALFCLIVPGSGKNVLFLIMVISGNILFGALTILSLIRGIYFFPKRRLVYSSGTIYYYEGNKKRVINRITGISYNRNSKSSYFTLHIKIPDEEKPLKFDLMSFKNPEVVYKIMLSKLSGESKREAVLKRVMRR